MNQAFQNLPIKRKLMTVMMLTSSVALLLSCVGFVGYQLLNFIQNEKQNLATMGDVIAANSTAALSFRDQSSAEETLRGLKAEPRILKACLYAKDGTVFATYTRDKNDQSCPPSVPRGGSATFDYNHLTLSRSVLLDGRNIGTLSLQADLAPEVLAYLRRAGSILLFVMAASLLAALLVSRRLQHFISDPLRGLVASTQELAGGNLSVRVAAASTDEFGELAHAFNEMAGSLQYSHAEILNYQQTLEQRVKDRTLELEKEIAERKQAERALRDSEARYRVLFDNAAEGVWLMTDTFLDCNKNACELFACNREDVIGHSPIEFSPLTQPDGKDSAQAARERIASALGGHPQLFYWQSKRKDGTLVDAEISLADVTIGGQHVILAISRDITERRRTEAQMEDLHRQLLEISREAGMAEVATNVLHNVGNVLNSVNVSTALVSEKIRESRVSSLAKVVALMRARQNDLAAFLTEDPKGVQLCDYLDNLAQYLGKEQTEILKELESLNANIGHIKEIVTMQQSYARAAGIVETLPIVDLAEDALRINSGALARHEVQVVREYIATPSAPVDKHKALQILVNLVRNAKYALDEGGRKDKRLTIRVATDGEGSVTISVIDNGVGIPPENLTRIFSYGFTTRKNGHGFGLHSGALAAKEMGGSLSVHSDGPGQGAAFTLSLPLHQEHKKV
jgi:PAS domain S-box-containing protein